MWQCGLHEASYVWVCICCICRLPFGEPPSACMCVCTIYVIYWIRNPANCWKFRRKSSLPPLELARWRRDTYGLAFRVGKTIWEAATRRLASNSVVKTIHKFLLAFGRILWKRAESAVNSNCDTVQWNRCGWEARPMHMMQASSVCYTYFCFVSRWLGSFGWKDALDLRTWYGRSPHNGRDLNWYLMAAIKEKLNHIMIISLDVVLWTRFDLRGLIM